MKVMSETHGILLLGTYETYNVVHGLMCSVNAIPIIRLILFVLWNNHASNIV